MRIKNLSIAIGSRSIDSPKHFPAPTSPSLKTAPEIRIHVRNADSDNDQDLQNDVNNIDHDAKIIDSRRNINFGGRVLCSADAVIITFTGQLGNRYILRTLFPNGAQYEYLFLTKYQFDRAKNLIHNVGIFSKLVTKMAESYKCLVAPTVVKPKEEQLELELSDAKLTYQNSGESTTNMIKDAYHLDSDEECLGDKDPKKPLNLPPLHQGPIDIELLRKAAMTSPIKKKELSMYEDQKRKQG